MFVSLTRVFHAATLHVMRILPVISFFRRWKPHPKKNAPVAGTGSSVGVTPELDVHPAAPSKKVGLQVQEGTGTYFMSSDAAPALDQDISPTWTGDHDFKGSVNVPTMPASDSSDHAASTAFVKAAANTGSSSTHAGDPTATVGLTAKNGTKDTFMRSDAAPALDTSISPTWTGSHDFSRSKISVKTQAPGDNSLNAASTAFVHAAVQGSAGATSTTGFLKVQYVQFKTYQVLFEATYKLGEFAYIARPGDIVQLETGEANAYKVLESTQVFLDNKTKQMTCVVTLQRGA